MQINNDYMVNAFDNMTPTYKEAVKTVGLWKSEKYLIEKYFNKNNKILDMGCGAGRTTIAMIQLGFTNTVGRDFSTNMIDTARKIALEMNLKIDFKKDNCLNIHNKDNEFDGAIFSFNGLMQIPNKDNRVLALKELLRVVKPQSYIFFTTHDRNASTEDFLEFWKEEKFRWKKGLQDKRLHDFGDIISKSDQEEQEYFINIPSKEEIVDMISKCDCILVETFLRSELFIENEEVKEFSTDCRFWIIKKNN